MLDYKDIIIKSYALNLSGAELARQLGCSKSGVNDFLNAFKKCKALSFPLPEGITNYGIAELVYGKAPIAGNRDESFELPDSLSGGKQGFGYGKAVAGAVLLGGVGLLAGGIGANKTVVTCLNCGYKFKM